jgi:hypothetical protein
MAINFLKKPWLCAKASLKLESIKVFEKTTNLKTL